MSAVTDSDGVVLFDLEELLAQRRQILPEYAALKALHGPFGKYENRRKQMLAALRLRARIVCQEKGVKPTEAMLDDMARDDKQYDELINEGIEGAARYFVLETEMAEIADKIEHGRAQMYYAGAEMRLTR